jgi:hypothetical protein
MDRLRLTHRLSANFPNARLEVQPPDAANRTSGGVGGGDGRNPVTSTRFFKTRSLCGLGRAGGTKTGAEWGVLLARRRLAVVEHFHLGQRRPASVVGAGQC